MLGLIETIARAFANVPRPDDREYTSSPGGEALEESSEFFGKDWRALTPDFLHTYRDVLFWFNPSAFLYYLPAFLTAAIRSDDSNAIYVHTILQLLRKKEDDSFSRERWMLLSEEQIRVLQEWLSWLLKQAPPGGVFEKEVTLAMEAISNRRWWGSEIR